MNLSELTDERIDELTERGETFTQEHAEAALRALYRIQERDGKFWIELKAVEWWPIKAYKTREAAEKARTKQIDKTLGR